MKGNMRVFGWAVGGSGICGFLLWLRLDAACRAPAIKPLIKHSGGFNCWEAWFYRYQTLVIGLISVSVAAIAAYYVFQQVKQLMRQNDMTQEYRHELLRERAKREAVEQAQKLRLEQQATPKVDAFLRAVDTYIDCSKRSAWKGTKQAEAEKELRRQFGEIYNIVIDSGFQQKWDMPLAEHALNGIAESCKRLAGVGFSREEVEKELAQEKRMLLGAFGKSEVPQKTVSVVGEIKVPD